ncbi:receptor-type tyrosine-protein phosphatase beta-like isoform X4 [Chelmon rostratus]|uniref:receptor-type tyrosine-protein phosphatase beta-like isoform X4 n=1 Tax=Chelmon rostratus TaxID=109905 RepID=UPI001BE7C68D|nr:receptor-type tyrosine-protein phosphatase beta-like isoform X4 [Chelmon rostratus]
MTKPLSFRITSAHLLLCVFLLGGITDSSTPSAPGTVPTGTSSTEATSLTTLSTTKPPPESVKDVKVSTQNETSITLMWDTVNNISTYFLQYNDSVSSKEESISVSHQEATVTHVVSSLTAGTKYSFKLITAFAEVNSTGYTFEAVTAPVNAKEFKSVGQDETSITLQWVKVDDFLNYKLVYSEGEINVNASAGHEQVAHTISGLTSGTKYEFSLFTVFETVNSSGVSLTAVTAPKSVKDVKVSTQNETSITLVWDTVNNISTYFLQYDDNVSSKEESISVSHQEASVTHVVSSLTAGTKYSFKLTTVFAEVNSTGYTFEAVTAPVNAKEFKSVGQNETSITLQWVKVDDFFNYKLVYSEGEINVNASAGHEQVTHTISGLTNGTKYEFSLFTVFETVSSSGVTLTAVTAPENVEAVKVSTQNETSITLMWDTVNNISTYFLQYNDSVSLKEESISVSHQEATVTHVVSSLTAGTKYSFKLITVFAEVNSTGYTFEAVTAPESVKDVKVSTQNETSITLMWDTVNNISTYFLQYNDSVSSKEESISVSHQEATVTHVVSSLTAGTKYSFKLITVFAEVNSTGYTFEAVTVPSMVPLVTVTERSVTSITLMWNVTVDKDWSYFLEMNEEKLLFQPRSRDVVSHSFTSLQPGTEYPFSVITMFSGLNSTAYKDFTLTAINCATVTWHLTNSSIHGMIEGLFTFATATYESKELLSPGGSNVSFTGLYPGATYEVSLVYERNSKRFQQCSHNLTIIPPDLSARCEYLAAGYSALIVLNKMDGVWNAVKLDMNGENCTVNKTQQIEVHGLQPAKTYEVSLASLSKGGTSSPPFVFLCSTDPRGVIAGSVFAVLLFGALVGLFILILHKRPDIISRKKAFIGGSKLSKKCKAISVAKFPDHFYQLSEDENRGFSLEYESLSPVGTEQTRKEALLPENKARNRFTNVLPYDWCRVKLTTSNSNGTSDYINASYMPGYNSNREYIATQGPLPSTVNDFWRMVWEQRVRGIVMVTNCTEGGRTKCERYWPADSEPCLHGELLVTMKSEQQEPNWTLREFWMKHNNTSEKRIVKHFHFTAWPDHGVPQSTEVLIQFRGLVRQHIQRDGAGVPTVVHCSAGVGRTGTIIALDVLLQQLVKDREVGINAFVHKMRLSRPHMVQTESQYVFLHQCIMDCLKANEKTEENIYENADMIYANATALREFHQTA